MVDTIHKSVMAPEVDKLKILEGSDPSSEADRGSIYTKDVGGSTELFYITSAGVVIQLTEVGLAKSFPSGTKAPFYQGAAPTGWTLDASINDRVLIATNSSGGTTGGGWTITGLISGSFTLTETHIPAHRHQEGTVHRGDGTGFHTRVFGTAATSQSGRINEHHQSRSDGARAWTQTVGGGSSHSHSISQDGSWRPSHATVIICTKN